MKTMKNLFFCLSLFCVMICFYSCSDKEETVNEVEMNQVADENQQVEVQNLISFIESLNANQAQTRGRFWDRVKLFFIGDAWGYGWGMEVTNNPKIGLISAVVFSIIFATSDSDVPSRWWHLNSNWRVYDLPVRDYERIGNDHNKAIYEMMTTDRTLTSGTFSNDYLYNSANKKLKSFGYNDEMSMLTKTRLMLTLDKLRNCSTVSQMRNLMQQESPQRMSEFQLVETYVDGLQNRSDKKIVRDYTLQVYSQIDASALNGAAISRVKTMIAIAENSKFLWLETE